MNVHGYKNLRLMGKKVEKFAYYKKQPSLSVGKFIAYISENSKRCAL